MRKGSVSQLTTTRRVYINQKAAVQGHAPSQGALGYLFRRGNGVDKDFIEATKWYRLAAEQGDVLAANRLAWLMAACPV
jgi:TPR repeat protein